MTQTHQSLIESKIQGQNIIPYSYPGIAETSSICHGYGVKVQTMAMRINSKDRYMDRIRTNVPTLHFHVEVKRPVY